MLFFQYISIRLLSEERLELALLVVPAPVQGGELLLRVLQALGRLRCLFLALLRPLERGVPLSLCLLQPRGPLFSRRELDAEGGALSFGVSRLCLECLQPGLEVSDLGAGLLICRLRLTLCCRECRLGLV